jgi:hypothetical protein
VKLCVLLGVHLVGFLLPGAVVVGLWQTRSNGQASKQFPVNDAAGIAITPVRRDLERRSVSPILDLLRTLVVSGVIAYGSFFAYVLSPVLGRAYSLLVFGGSIAVLVRGRGVRRYLGALGTHRDVLSPLLIAVCVGWLYTGSTLLYGGQVHVSLVANSRYRDPLPPDNILPQLVAERVVDGIRGEPFLGDWLSSDRPPLQSAVETLVSPLLPKGSRELNYQALATMLQLLVIPAGWVLLRLLGIGLATTLGVVTATALSGTVALHSTYVWPKLLCAAYSMLALGCLVSPHSATAGVGSPEQDLDEESHESIDHGLGVLPYRLLGHGRFVLARGLLFSGRGLWFGAALGLSFASHGGALFVALPILCVLVIRTATRGWQGIRPRRGLGFNETKGTGPGSTLMAPAMAFGSALAVCALLFAPWFAYQRVVAPPGNRLLKWHLAGVVQIDERSVAQALRDEYTKASWRAIVSNKTSNVRELLNPDRFLADVLPVLGSDDSIDRVRQREFGALANATSIAVVGIGLGFAGLVVNRRRSRELVVGVLGLGSAVLATVLWCAVMFGPKATIPHQGSALVPLVAIGSSALLAASAHRWALAGFVGLSAYKVTRVWILAGPLSPERERSAAAFGVLLFGAVALLGVVFNVLRQHRLASDLPEAQGMDRLRFAAA